MALLLSIVVTVVLITRWMRQPEYDWRFLEDENEDILGIPAKHGYHPVSAKESESFQGEYGSRKQARTINTVIEPMARGHDGLTRMGDWAGRHPLFEIIQRAEDDFRKENASRPATVRL
jgi:hypothetical protein